MRENDRNEHDRPEYDRTDYDPTQGGRHDDDRHEHGRTDRTWTDDDWSAHDPDANHDTRGEDHDDRPTGRSRIEHAPNPDRRGRWLSVILGLVGIWILAAAVWFDPAPAQATSALLAGTLVLVVSVYNYYRRSNEELASADGATLAAIAGLWLVASPFLAGPDLAFEGTANGAGAWSTVVAGLLVFGIGTYSAYAIRERRIDADARETATYDRSGH